MEAASQQARMSQNAPHNDAGANSSSPHSPRLCRSVCVGGVPTQELLSRLLRAGVQLNAAAHALFADDRFTTSPTSICIEIIELSVADLGFREGATFATIVESAAESGLSLCPLELGPHLRLQYPDQPESSLTQPAPRHCAPPGSMTVASAPISDDDEIPKGFYLRCIDGALWLRGYRASAGHVWGPQDVFVFSRSGEHSSSAVTHSS
jgi:hypothetical protein